MWPTTFTSVYMYTHIGTYICIYMHTHKYKKNHNQESWNNAYFSYVISSLIQTVPPDSNPPHPLHLSLSPPLPSHSIFFNSTMLQVSHDLLVGYTHTLTRKESFEFLVWFLVFSAACCPTLPFCHLPLSSLQLLAQVALPNFQWFLVSSALFWSYLVGAIPTSPCRSCGQAHPMFLSWSIHD
jgi:hypothetical protein